MARARKSDTPALDLGPVLIHYGATSLPSRYGWHTMRCPFPEHNDRTSSARVNLGLGGFTCLACGVSGDAIKIIRDREGLSFGQAIEWARQIFGSGITPISDAVPKPVATKRIGRHRWKDVLD